MAHITINQYLQQVYDALDNHEGSFCAELLSFKHPHVANPRLQLTNPEDKCQQVLEPPYDEMVAAHLRSPERGQGSPERGQGSPEAGQGSPEAGQGSPEAGQGSPEVGQRSPERGQGSPERGQGSPEGHMPTLQLLRKYDLMQFADVTKAVREGNLLLLNEALVKHETFFIRCGIFLILEKLKIITYRNLFKTVYQLLGSHQLPLEAFLVCLRMMKVEDIDLDEVQCLLANLIYM
ncbi:hypothetical protein NHX12_015619, partial [Muraenolepis orangiensis]